MIYIGSYAHISSQKPFSDDFFLDPVPCVGDFLPTVEADCSAFFTPMAARRMGPMLKRAIATATVSLREAGVTEPDAVICGTGLGCLENTEKFLNAMIDNGEEFLQPTLFMNSTHNTVASHIANTLGCHGYNNTFSHLGLSFESGLMDAVMQFELGRIHTAMVGAYDEMTPTYHRMLDMVRYWDAPFGECAVSFVLRDTPCGESPCVLKDVDMLYGCGDADVLSALGRFLRRNSVDPSAIGCIVTGKDGDQRYDPAYDKLISGLFHDTALCRYRHVFGQSFTSSAYGLMLGVEILRRRMVPDAYRYAGTVSDNIDNILIINTFHNKEWSFILIGK